MVKALQDEVPVELGACPRPAQTPPGQTPPRPVAPGCPSIGLGLNARKSYICEMPLRARAPCTGGGTGNILYWENIEGGHGGAADNKQRAHMWALTYEFLIDALSGKR